MNKVLFVLLAAGLPALAHAYVGPGAGLSAIGSTIALIFGLLVAILGFIWYPLKRLLRGRQGATLDESSAAAAEADDNGSR